MNRLGVGGIVKGKCIECPFHQWRFSGVDGTVVDVPYSENFSESKFHFSAFNINSIY